MTDTSIRNRRMGLILADLKETAEICRVYILPFLKSLQDRREPVEG